MDVSNSPLIETHQDGAVPVPGGSHAASNSTEKAKIRLTLKRVPVESWDGIVSEFDGVCQEMTAVFAQHRWPGVLLEPVIMLDRDEPVAGALVMIQRLPLGLARMAVIKWGPALRHETGDTSKIIYAQAIDLLIEEYANKRGMMLSIMARAPRRRDAECVEFLKFRGFRQGSGLLFPDRYMVKVRLDDVALRRSLLQKWRYHLNKAEKEDLEFTAAGPDRLPEFAALYEAMTDRKRFPDYSAYETVPRLMAAEVEALRPRLFFVSKDGKVVAGALVFSAGSTAAYLYGATNDEALPLRAGYFMQWHIVRWLRDNTKAEFYDLGGTDGFQGLHQFKKGLVGGEGQISPVPPIANFASNPVALVLGTSAYKARDLLHDARRFVNWMRNDMARPNQER